MRLKYFLPSMMVLSALFMAGRWPDAGSSLVGTGFKIASSFGGADLSDKIESAAAASPAGGTVLITSSATLSDTANITTANTTIQCVPGVVLTQAGTNKTTFSIEAANVTIRGCTANGQKNTLNETFVGIEAAGDGAVVEENYAYDFRNGAVLFDPSNTDLQIDSVTIRANKFVDNVAASGTIAGNDLISGTNGSFLTNVKILDNTLIHRDGHGDAILLFVKAPGSYGITVRGNYMESEGRTDNSHMSACTELTGTDGSGGTVMTHPTDFITGTVVSDNICNLYGYNLAGMNPFGFAKDPVFVGNTLSSFATTGSSGFIAFTEIGSVYGGTVSGNTFQGMARDISLHNVQNLTISGNTFTFKCPTWQSCDDEAIFMEEGALDPTHFLQTKNLSITGNTFNYPSDNSKNQQAMRFQCDGNTFAGGWTQGDSIISGNAFRGIGTPTGKLSYVATATILGAVGNCFVRNLQFVDNYVFNVNHLFGTNVNHTFDDFTFARNTLRTLVTGWFAFGAGSTETNFYVNGYGADAPVTGAQCGDGSQWIDTNTAGDVNCVTANNGALCRCVGGAWLAVGE